MDSNFRGPLTSMGAMEDNPATVQPMDGPSYLYQGYVLPNLRSLYNKDGTGAGRSAGFLNHPRMVLVDNIPSTLSTTALSTAAGVATNSPMTLTTIAPGGGASGVPSIAPVIPIIPFGSSVPVNAALALDFGFTAGTTAAGSGIITTADNTLFTLGQWLLIGGVGNAAKTTSLLTQVTAINSTNSTGITVSPAPAGTLANAPIGAANLFNQFLPPATQFGPAAAAANAHSLSIAAGAVRAINPAENLARGISITAVSTAGAGGAFKVVGWDLYGMPMTETITVTANSTTSAWGKKAFKYIASVLPQITDTATSYSVGVTDVFGFALRCDRWEYLECRYNANIMVASTGFVAPDLTSPAISTTGDVRGTVQLSAGGAGTALPAPLVGASNNARRLFIAQTMPLYNTVYGTPLNTVPWFGQAQA